MKNVFTAPVQLWHLILVVVVIAALASTVVASAAPLSSFLAQGNVRMAFAANPNTMSIAPGTHKVGLQQTITIPAGKHADLAVIGAVDFQGGGLVTIMYCFGLYRLDNATTGTPSKPGNTILIGFNPSQNNLTTPVNGWFTNVGSGTHTVYMDLSASFGICTPQYRQMMIFANIH